MKLLLIVFVAFCCASAAVVRMGLQGKRLKRLPNPPKAIRAIRSSYNEKLPQPLSESNLAYAAEVTVGTPPQPFTMVVDISSGDFWVYDSSCDECTDPFIQVNMFNSSQSKTFEALGKEFRTVEGYEMEGFLGRDSMTFGSANGDHISLTEQVIGFGQFKDSPFGIDGCLGLAFPAASSPGFVPPLYRAINQGLLDKPIFSLYLGKPLNGFNSGKGMLTYGDLDTENCGDVLGYVPLNNARDWNFRSKNFAIGNYSENTEVTVYFWTISDDAYLPEKVFAQLVAATGAEKDSDYGSYQVDCAVKIPILKLTTGSITLEIKLENFVTKTDRQVCYLLIQPITIGDTYSYSAFGIPFFYDYCTVHDIGRQRIGFAPVKN